MAAHHCGGAPLKHTWPSLINTAAGWFCLLCCLLFGSFSGYALADDDTGKPQYWFASTSGTETEANSELGAKDACEKSASLWIATRANWELIRCEQPEPNAYSELVSVRITGPGGIAEWNGKREFWTIVQKYTNPFTGETQVDSTYKTSVVARCNPAIAVPQTTTYSCRCIANLMQAVHAGYWDRGFYPSSYTYPPRQYCHGAKLNNGVWTLSDKGCTAEFSYAGTFSGVLAGIQHSYVGGSYIGKQDSCNAPVEPPKLEGYVPSNACPAGFRLGPKDGAYMCVRDTGLPPLNPQDNGSICQPGESCYFDPANPPGTPGTPVVPGTGGGPGPGTGTGTGTAPGWLSGICSIPGIDKVCAWFAPESNTLKNEGETIVNGPTTMELPTKEATITPILESPNWADNFVGSSANCPAPLSASTPWGDVAFSYQPVCSVLTAVAPIVYLIGVFIAMGIVFRRGD